MSLVLENKVNQAINIIKLNSKKSNTIFFESYILLILDSIKKKNFNKASELLEEVPKYLSKSRINLIILDSLKQYVYIFHNKKILKNNPNFGNLSFISETFLRCYLEDKIPIVFFSIN